MRNWTAAHPPGTDVEERMWILAFKSWHPPWASGRVHARARLSLARCVYLLLESLEERCVPSAVAVPADDQTASPATLRDSGDLLGFENGLAGWKQNPGDTGVISVVTSWTAAGGTDPQ